MRKNNLVQVQAGDAVNIGTRRREYIVLQAGTDVSVVKPRYKSRHYEQTPRTVRTANLTIITH